jgi:UDP-glucose 6-dehydrogenase
LDRPLSFETARNIAAGWKIDLKVSRLILNFDEHRLLRLVLPNRYDTKVDYYWKEIQTVKAKQRVVVAGLGEVGKPLFQIASEHHDVIGIDITPPTEKVGEIDVLHVCYPFQMQDFVGETTRYIELFRPELTVVNSTVGVGTTRAIAQRTGTAVVNSPVRGKHTRMQEELCSYTKFVGAMDPASGQRAAEHFESLGFKTRILSSPEATELAKLTETTYFGLMIAWAQEVERYCDRAGQNYEELVSFYDEITFFPKVKYFPGVIGGHCVMPNIQILRKFDDSAILRAIQSSNQKKIDRETSKELSDQIMKGKQVAVGSGN